MAGISVTRIYTGDDGRSHFEQLEIPLAETERGLMSGRIPTGEGVMFRATPPGGSVRVSAIHEGGSAVVEVADTGVGIAPEHLPHIFDRLYRADSARDRASGGTGLGLAIVKHVVSRHRGHLAIDSQPGQGVTFTVYLPTQ